MMLRRDRSSKGNFKARDEPRNQLPTEAEEASTGELELRREGAGGDDAGGGTLTGGGSRRSGEGGGGGGRRRRRRRREFAWELRRASSIPCEFSSARFDADSQARGDERWSEEEDERESWKRRPI